MAVPDLVEKQTEPVRLKMSYEEFLRWSDEDTHAEWVDSVNPNLLTPRRKGAKNRGKILAFFASLREIWDCLDSNLLRLGYSSE